MKLSYLIADWNKNKTSIKSLFVVIFFRVSAFFARHPLFIIRLFGLPVRVVYKVLVEFFLGVELPDKLIVGPGLSVYHGVGLVVNSQTVIGSDVTLRQNTTIGEKYIGGKCPVIGNNVSIGANAVIIGDVCIGDGSVIGAGAVVVNNVPAGSVVVPEKSRVILRD